MNMTLNIKLLFRHGVLFVKSLYSLEPYSIFQKISLIRINSNLNLRINLLSNS
jgi:hypothetical protein